MADARDDRSDAWNAAVARAHARWPAEWVPAESFVEYLRGKIPAERDPEHVLPELAVPDLYLAFACACGVAAATA